MYTLNYRIKAVVLIILSFTFSLPLQATASNSNQSMTSAADSKKSLHAYESIVLIHGLMRTSWSMIFLKSFLEKQGYTVYSYSYPSAKYTIEEHSIRLNKFITNLLEQHPGMTFHFITHSLGGIISRSALAKMTPSQLNNIGYLIMMAPPNQGSDYAKVVVNTIPLIPGLIKPLAELSSAPSAYIHKVPVPKVKMGIIAGRYDAKSPPTSAKLNGVSEMVVINSAHTFIMNNSEARKYILAFLNKGTFKQ